VGKTGRDNEPKVIGTDPAHQPDAHPILADGASRREA